MAENDGAEKTEPASERKIEKSRKEGRVAGSRELTASVAMASAVIVGALVAPSMLENMVGFSRFCFQRGISGEIEAGDLPSLMYTGMWAVGPGLLAFLLPGSVAAVILGLAMTQFNYTTDALEPKFERIDPIKNLQGQMLSAQPWVGLLKSVMVGVVVAWAVYSAIESELHLLPASSSWPAGSQLIFLGRLIRLVFERAIPMTVLLGIGDYLYQIWRMNQQLMMTRQEVKEEHKDTEGDPLIKQRRRQMARLFTSRRRIEDVARADVVVTNPTHYAVALRYRKAENAAPVILARGFDLVALQIRTIAARNDVPIVENRALARALAVKGRVGGAVPPEFYGAVARVLAAVYRRKKLRST